MKKYFKKYLSVFMAVLMLMSSWVFFAPNKAEAVSSGTYHVEFWIKMNTFTNQAAANSSWLKFYGKDNNGTTQHAARTAHNITLYDREIKSYSSSEVNSAIFNRIQSNNQPSQKVLEFDTTSFPTSFEINVKVNRGSVNFHAYMKIRNANGESVQITPSDAGAWESFDNINGYGNATTVGAAGRTMDSAYPRISSVDVSGSDTLTIPKEGSTTSEYRTFAKDQYGVRIGGATRGALSLSSTVNSTTGFSASYGNTTSDYDPVTLNVSTDAKSRTYDINTLSLTSTYSFNGASATGSKTVLAYDPAYTMTFNPNGDGATTSPSGAYTNKYYYNEIASSISGTRLGFEFLGFFPRTKIADNFDAVKPTVGQGVYINQLTAPVRAEKDEDYYAAWWAKNANAIFVDQNGTRVAVIPSKYGKILTPAEVATVPAQEYHKLPGDTGTFDYVFTGWAVESAKDDAGNDITAELAGKSPTEITLKGETIFKPVFSVSKNSYTIKFHKIDGTVTSESLPYRAEPTVAPDQSVDATGEDYEIGFKGWTKVPTDGDNLYHTVDANGNCVNTGTYIPVESSFTVRGDADYYPVFQKTFAVTFENEDGTVLKTERYPQGAQAVPPEEIPTKAADDTYTYEFAGWKDGDEFAENYIVNSNRTFTAAYNQKLIEYTVTVTDEYGLNTETQTLHYGDKITYVDDIDVGGYTYTFKEWADGHKGDRFCEGNATYVATYNRIPAVYEIKFVSHDATQSAFVNHEEYLQESDIPNLVGTYYIDNQGTIDKGDDVKYTFVKWADEDGNAPSTTEQVTARNTYTAVYKAENAVSVTYHNGAQIVYTDYAFEGDSIPEYQGDTPTKPDDVYNTKYEFTGWKDANGESAPEVMGKEPINLYAQFNGEVVKYTIEFVRDDETPIQTQIVEYGWEVTPPEVPTTEDETFIYQFQSWSPAVESVCTGNATYTAVFKKVRVLYEVTFIVDGEVFRTQKFINGAKIAPPLNPTTSQQPSDSDHEWKFVGWKRLSDGHMYDGDRIDGANIVDKKLSYEAVFEEVSKAFTVTFVNDNGEVIQTVPGVEPNSKLFSDAIGIEHIPTDKNPDEDNHYKFIGWELSNGSIADKNTIVDGNMTVKATYEAEAHTVKTEILTPPTFDIDGTERDYCEKCYYELSEETAIPALTDSVAPQGVIVIEGEKWEDITTDTDAITPISHSSVFNVNTIDKGDTNELYNKDGLGSGVKKIELSAQTSMVDFDSIADSDWKVVATGKKAAATLNHSIHVSEIEFLKDKTDGFEFAVYAKITDYKGNVTKLNTTMLVLDETAPLIEIEKTQSVDATKACDIVTVKVTDETELQVVVKHDGHVVSTALTGVFTAIGNYEVTATDVVGNVTRESFTINDHDWATHTKKPTCATEGSMQDQCAVCGVKKELIVVPPTGEHVLAQEGVRHDAVCDNNGYTTYQCIVCKQFIDVYDDPATEGHDFQVIERLEPTCSTEGYLHVQCSICGEVRETILPKNDNHNYVVIERVEPTIYKDGYIKYQCTNNPEHVDIVPIPKLYSFFQKVTVKDTAGNFVQGATVKVYKNGNLIATGVTGDQGTDTFRFETEGVYTFEVKANDYTTYTGEQSVVPDTKDQKNPVMIYLDRDSREHDCTCMCHKDGFFANIFRFFQKISKFFTKHYNCCSDPDLEKYNKK